MFGKGNLCQELRARALPLGVSQKGEIGKKAVKADWERGRQREKGCVTARDRGPAWSVKPVPLS